ncbi:segregation/condensation protein A [Pseudomonas sp. PDM19]|nr:segregation/condensation protein A [Pseudomonas sp. PDM19]
MSDLTEPEAPAAAPEYQVPVQLALVYGEALTEMPQDLYIPPDALEVFLEAFEGPLDLLLYLIRKQNINILDIPVAEITRQYMGYVELMKSVRLELAAEYLVMAAMLAEIKSRMLLPRSAEAEEEEEDPRAELIRRLQEYERFKKAAEDLDDLPRLGRDYVVPTVAAPDARARRLLPEVDMQELMLCMAEVLRRADLFESHQVTREMLSTRERMTEILERLKGEGFVPFISLFRVEEGKLGVVVTFMAVLELVKEQLVELVQNEAFAPIHVRARTEVQEGAARFGEVPEDVLEEGDEDVFEPREEPPAELTFEDGHFDGPEGESALDQALDSEPEDEPL